MKTIELTVGKKVQRKGSSVIWTIENDNCFANSPSGIVRINDTATEVRLSCIPKNRTSKMYEWVSVENFNKNWREV